MRLVQMLFILPLPYLFITHFVVPNQTKLIPLHVEPLPSPSTLASLYAERLPTLRFPAMGNCLSLKKSNQQNQQDNSPSLAATLASTAANVVTDFIQSQQAPANAANSQYTNPSGLKVIENAYVFRMPDGDTFSCDYINDNGEKATARVRIMGIDCPESKQNFGQEAKEIGEKLIFRTSVTLYVHTTDRYGRIVADVITPKGLNYGEELLRQGAAWHYKQYDRRQEYADLETKAREQNIGLWSYPRPLQPWEYRRRQRDK